MKIIDEVEIRYAIKIRDRVFPDYIDLTAGQKPPGQVKVNVPGIKIIIAGAGEVCCLKCSIIVECIVAVIDSFIGVVAKLKTE